MNPARILILSASPLCRNPRVLKEATTLGHAGYDVTVLTVAHVARFEQQDQALMPGLPFKRITLDYAADTLPVRFANFFQRSQTWAARQMGRRLGIETAATLGPASALLRLAHRTPAELTIAHTEIPLWCAKPLIRSGRRVAVDLEDWHSEDLLPADRAGRPFNLLREAEAFALRHAAYVSTPSACMAAALTARFGGIPPIVLHNSFPLERKSSADRPFQPGGPRFVWFSQTIGPGRGLEQFLSAWSRTTQSGQVCLIGDARPGFEQHLRQSLPTSRQADLSILPSLPLRALHDKLTEFDFGLALENTTPPNRDFTVSNKILQYLNAGLAIIATDTAGQREVFQAAPACGVILSPSSPAQWTQEIDALLADPERHRRMKIAARTAAETIFCWEKETPKLLAAVAGALSRPVGSAP